MQQLDRIEPFHSCFENAKKTDCIDHHISNGSFADVNVVDAQASSACEVLYRTLEDDIELTTDLRGMEGFHLVEHIVMEESDLKLVNSSYEEKVVPKTVNRSKMDGGIMTTLLGKASWNVIRLSK